MAYRQIQLDDLDMERQPWARSGVALTKTVYKCKEIELRSLFMNYVSCKNCSCVSTWGFSHMLFYISDGNQVAMVIFDDGTYGKRNLTDAYLQYLGK